MNDYETIIKNCPILFCQRNKSAQETCMCWGIEAGIGWYKPLNKLCSYLEKLNKTYYPKYRVRIQADQVKEKYGELRFYYSIVTDRNCVSHSFFNIFDNISHYIDNHVKFNIEKKIIEPEQTEEKWVETDKETYDNTNSESIKQENNKYYIKQISYHPAKIKFIATNHKFLYKISRFCSDIYWKSKYSIKLNKKQEEIGKMLSEIADALINKCENDCWNVCEWCGKEGGLDGENLITTSGWISRICRECSQKSIQERIKEQCKREEKEYKPVITYFQDGYEQLNAYYPCFFSYNKNHYGSIVEAFYNEKDNKKYNSIFKVIFKYFDKSNVKNEGLKEVIRLIVKLLRIKNNKKDVELLKNIVKTKFSDKRYKDILLSTKDYELYGYVDDCDNLFGSCLCNKCKNVKNKGLYVKILNEVRKELIENEKAS